MMPVPLSQDPLGSSVQRASRPSGDSTSSHITAAPTDPPAPTDAVAANNSNQAALHDSSASETAPTVISSMRPKLAGADAQHAESLIGRRLGHFELIESVGVGG